MRATTRRACTHAHDTAQRQRRQPTRDPLITNDDRLCFVQALFTHPSGRTAATCQKSLSKELVCFCCLRAASSRATGANRALPLRSALHPALRTTPSLHRRLQPPKARAQLFLRHQSPPQKLRGKCARTRALSQQKEEPPPSPLLQPPPPTIPHTSHHRPHTLSSTLVLGLLFHLAGLWNRNRKVYGAPFAALFWALLGFLYFVSLFWLVRFFIVFFRERPEGRGR